MHILIQSQFIEHDNKGKPLKLNRACNLHVILPEGAFISFPAEIPIPQESFLYRIKQTVIHILGTVPMDDENPLGPIPAGAFTVIYFVEQVPDAKTLQSPTVNF